MNWSAHFEHFVCNKKHVKDKSRACHARTSKGLPALLYCCQTITKYTSIITKQNNLFHFDFSHQPKPWTILYYSYSNEAVYKGMWLFGSDIIKQAGVDLFWHKMLLIYFLFAFYCIQNVSSESIGWLTQWSLDVLHQVTGAFQSKGGCLGTILHTARSNFRLFTI